jgi:hypothetical protein
MQIYQANGPGRTSCMFQSNFIIRFSCPQTLLPVSIIFLGRSLIQISGLPPTALASCATTAAPLHPLRPQFMNLYLSWMPVSIMPLGIFPFHQIPLAYSMIIGRAGLLLLAMGGSHQAVPPRGGCYWAHIPTNVHRGMDLCLVGVRKSLHFVQKLAGM